MSTAAYIVRKPDGTAKVGIALDDDKSKSVTTVIRITPGGLAAAAGIPIGAVILSVNGEVVTGMEQGAALIKAAVGDVEILAQPPPPATPPTLPPPAVHSFEKPDASAKVGIVLAQSKCARGNVVVVDSVKPGGLAAGAGLEAGQVVRAVNGVAITNYEQALNRIRLANGRVEIEVEVGNGEAGATGTASEASSAPALSAVDVTDDAHGLAASPRDGEPTGADAARRGASIPPGVASTRDQQGPAVVTLHPCGARFAPGSAACGGGAPSKPSPPTPPPRRALFLHGYADCPELCPFMYAGLEQAFPGLEVVSPAGVVKLTTAEVKEHGVGNEICTMAMAGELEVHSWSPPGLDASDRTKLEPAVNAMEAKIRADGGYSIICGFSMGGEVAYRLIDRLESIHAAVAERTRMVVLCCNGDFVMDTPPNPPTVGSPLKLFHMRGTGALYACQLLLLCLRTCAHTCTHRAPIRPPPCPFLPQEMPAIAMPAARPSMHPTFAARSASTSTFARRATRRLRPASTASQRRPSGRNTC
jgi:hypothetical protein